jgi:hypothetical protein
MQPPKDLYGKKNGTKRPQGLLCFCSLPVRKISNQEVDTVKIIAVLIGFTFSMTITHIWGITNFGIDNCLHFWKEKNLIIY